MDAASNTEVLKTLRKNFTMSVSTANELDFLANISGKKQSRIIQELIHNESEQRQNELRLSQLKKLKGIFTGVLSNGQSIQTIKSERTL